MLLVLEFIKKKKKQTLASFDVDIDIESPQTFVVPPNHEPPLGLCKLHWLLYIFFVSFLLLRANQYL